MTQDEIMEMAKQVGYPIQHPEWQKATEEFTALVTAKEQEAIIDLVAFYGGPVDLEAAIRARGQA